MFTTRRRVGPFISLTVAAALVLSACGSSNGDASSPSDAAGSTVATEFVSTEVEVPYLDWTDCGDGLLCAEAGVPMDYDEPGGAQVSLQLVKRPASDTEQRIGSLFVNDGGPGNSPIAFVRGDALDVLPADVQARFDVIGFDPRGVGSSSPIQCFANADDQGAFFSSHTGFPVGADEEAAFAAGSAEIGQRCADTNGEILEHVSTANVARDLDLLRRAVGDEQLNYVGYSYGGLLGLTYANLFPDTIRTMLIDGVTDPVAWSTTDPAATKAPVSARLGSDTATTVALQSFFELCEQAGDKCSFGDEDVAAKFDTLMARLGDGPVELVTPDGSIPITLSFVIDSMRGGLQFPPAWPFIADQLEAVQQVAFPADAAETADSTTPESTDESSEPTPEADGDAGEPEGAADEPVYDNAAESLLAVLCSETVSPIDPAAWSAAAANANGSFFGADWTYVSQPCATWPAVDADAYHGPFTATTSSPLLFVNSTADAASDFEKAKRVAAAMPGAGFLTLDGPGHPASFMGNSCVNAAISDYLLRPVMPAAAAVCDNEVQPFG